MLQTVNQTRVYRKNAFCDRFCVRHLFDLQFTSEPYMKRSVTLFFEAAGGGRFYVSNLNQTGVKMCFAIGFALYTCLIYSLL